MPSRRKRKRERSKAEATAHSPGTCGGWGNGLPTTLSDLVMLRSAINEDWPVPDNVRQAICVELGQEDIESSELRRVISIVRTYLTMDRANMRATRIALKEFFTG